jgi:ZIP family zinc transporter
VSVWYALFWGGFSSASLYIGQALAGPLGHRQRLTSHVMAFGAGTLLSAVAYELIPESSLSHGLGIGISVALGALVYYVADRIVDTNGGEKRQEIDGADVTGSGLSMFLGALLDGIPEAYVLGITLALGGTINVAFVAAVFVSNIPQGVAGTTALKAAGSSDRRIFRMWTALSLAAAVLTMLADSMLPESYEHGGRSVGLTVVLGYLVAAALVVLQ